jgi:hypothetical protein
LKFVVRTTVIFKSITPAFFEASRQHHHVPAQGTLIEQAEDRPRKGAEEALKGHRKSGSSSGLEMMMAAPRVAAPRMMPTRAVEMPTSATQRPG